jgi:acyl transferase domain-containing protein/NADP-dependent 3-hydroxy acid dehydrogenase YdfG
MPEHLPVAIIGMGCFFPKAIGLYGYWHLLYHGINAITEVPESHWSPSEYFDENPQKPDHVYCKRGGFLSKIAFDPSEFGIPPSTMEATDTSQLLGLQAAKMALEDAGYSDGKNFDRNLTSVILGVTGTQELVIPLSSRLGYPKWRKALRESEIPPDKTEEIIQRISDSYVPWQESSFPGLLGNVVAGRICNRLDLKGTNCVVDAACASSLSAIHLAVLELACGRSEMVITGGVDTLNDIFMHMCFSKTHTLSATGDARPFSRHADGTVLGEGIGLLVLKSLKNAERDGDRIYALIKGIGTSSDGKSQSIYAPRVEGQTNALRMAYRNAGVSPATVGLVEAHGTGTRVGDRVEFQALRRIFSESEAKRQSCALGSVKSMIGHTKAAAGAAGLIKAALGLYHKVLPPTLKAGQPDPNMDIENSSFYLNTKSRPWLSNNGQPRRAGVSAFGFGGSNFHVVLEEYSPIKMEIAWNGSVDIIAYSAPEHNGLVQHLNQLKHAIDQGLSDQEFALRAAESRSRFSFADSHRILLVSEKESDKLDLVHDGLSALATGSAPVNLNSKNIFLGNAESAGRLAFVFPGQGSQYVEMGRDLICSFPEAFEVLNKADKTIKISKYLSDLIFPATSLTASDQQRHDEALRQTEHAQPAIGTISLAMLKVLQRFEIAADTTCGHSFGELTALCAAGWIDDDALLSLSATRGRLMANTAKDNNGQKGAMLAAQAPLEKLNMLIAKSNRDIVIANRNGPNQGVLSGPVSAIRDMEKMCREQKIRCVRLPVSAAFHSSQVKSAKQPFLSALKKIPITPTSIEVFSNTTAATYPDDPDKIRALLAEHLLHPVEFVKEIDHLHKSGVRTFLEVGPKSVLTELVRDILKHRPFHAIALDASAGKGNGIADLARLLCQVASLGHSVALDKWERQISTVRRPKMHIHLNGTNYQNTPAINKKQMDKSSEHKKKIANQGKENRQQINEKNIAMNKESKKPNEFILHALNVVQDGLKSMQELQYQTAKTHQKFLETQTAANRALQNMMQNTQQLAERSLGIQVEPVNKPAFFEEGIHSQQDYDRYTSTRETSGNNPFSEELPNSPEAGGLNAQGISEIHSKAADHDVSKKAINESSLLSDALEPQPQESDPSQHTAKAIEPLILNIVSQLTGYPVDMLGLDMDIEADLGIDSIKRVEILSTLEEKLPDLPSVSPEIVGNLKTLGQIAEYLTSSHKPDVAETQTQNFIDVVESPLSAKTSSQPDEPKLGIETVMLEVVSQLTGYPVDMLGLDMDIEADLGIDSIKRVEILSTLEEKLPDLPSVSPEIVGELKTLGQIADYLIAADSNDDQDGQAELKPSTADALPTIAPFGKQANHPDIIKIPRNVVCLREAPDLSEAPIVIKSNKKVFITDDNTGLSEQISDELSKMGLHVVRISLDILKSNKQLTEAAGLIIVQDPKSAAMKQNLKDAFELAQYLAPQLLSSASESGALLTTITRLDGAFGFKGESLSHPVQGGLAGLAKTAAIEWPQVCTHAIDISPKWTDNHEIAKSVVNDILTPGPIEIGHDFGNRWTLSLNPRPFPAGHINLKRDDVVVISGGARGITAAAASALAEHVKPALVLIGRSSEPEAEPDWLASAADEPAMKKAILDNEFQKHKVSPAQLEKIYKRYRANREISQNLKELRSTGARVDYHSVDVRNLDGLKSLLEKIRTTIGPIKGIIHGAGVLEDRLLVDKNLKQFERVFDTKVDGLDNLLQATSSDDLKYIVLFSSVAARLGNKGQVDYAMANEVINKTAQAEALKRPGCRVVSINWGPWDGGMVNSALKHEFERNGIPLIPAETGADCMLYEMMGNPLQPAEIVIGANIERPKEVNHEYPKLAVSTKRSAPKSNDHLSLVFKQNVDTDHYPILKSHIIDGCPVVPVALITEWFAHGALHESPGLVLHGLNDIRILKGIRLENNQRLIRLLAGKPKKNGEFFEVELELRDGKHAGQDIIHSRATAILSDQLSNAPPFQISKQMLATTYTRTIDEIYNKILFHGFQLHGIRKIVSCSSKGIVAQISPAPPPQEWISVPLRNHWIADPLVMDSAFQLATLWCFEENGIVSLPSYCKAYSQYHRQYPTDNVSVVLEIKEVSNRKMRGDFTFLDGSDEVIAKLLGYEAIMDASLIEAFKPQFKASA